MALVYADRVKEGSVTTGTGTYDLDGAATGFQGFVAAIGDTNTCFYCVTDGTDWEVGEGTVTDAATDTLSRDTISSSSNSGAAVNWGAGAKSIFVVLPAERISGNLTVDNFTDTTDYTSGTTTALTLSVTAGSETNIQVSFDGVTQHHDTYSLSGVTLTFDAAIPLGVDDVEVIIGTSATIGVPADGSVTLAKLASDVSGDESKVVDFSYSEDGALATGTNTVPMDNTKPQSGEGDQYLSVSHTPDDATNILKVEVTIQVSYSVVSWIAVALFKDAGVDALASNFSYMNSGYGSMVSFTHYIVAGSTSAQTFKVRAGANNPGTFTMNGVAGGGKHGGIIASSIAITELLP